MDTETLTIGKVFQNKNYSTACFGKWHLGFKEGKNDWQVPLNPGPLDVGFDRYFGLGVVNSGPPYVYIDDYSFVGYDASDPLVYGGKPVSPTPKFPKEASVKVENEFSGALKAHEIYDDEKTGTLLTEKAVQWITEKKDKPFFLYFATPNIHHPCTPALRFKGTSQCGLYGDFVHELDWMVGEQLLWWEARKYTSYRSNGGRGCAANQLLHGSSGLYSVARGVDDRVLSQTDWHGDRLTSRSASCRRHKGIEPQRNHHRRSA